MFRKAYLLSFVLVFVLGVFCSGEIRPFADLALDLQFSSPPVRKVKNVPESIRNVPIHKDDAWGTPGPIMEDDADAPWMTEIRFLNLGLESDIGQSMLWRNYLDLSFNYSYWFKAGGDVQERNYTNAVDTEKRGYGAALTFWTPNYDIFIPGFRSELQFDKESNWYLGTGVRQYNLGILTGWDRYDSLENGHFTRIGKITEFSFYLGWSDEGNSNEKLTSNARIGFNFNMYGGKSKYRDIDVDVNPVSFFFAVDIAHRF